MRQVSQAPHAVQEGKGIGVATGKACPVYPKPSNPSNPSSSLAPLDSPSDDSVSGHLSHATRPLYLPYLDLICCTLPRQHRRPLRRMATRELRASASPIECVLSSKARRAPCRRRRAHKRRLLTGSSPVEGSSRSSVVVSTGRRTTSSGISHRGHPRSWTQKQLDAPLVERGGQGRERRGSA